MEIGNQCVPLVTDPEDEEVTLEFAVHSLHGDGLHTGSAAETLRGAGLASK